MIPVKVGDDIVSYGISHRIVRIEERNAFGMPIAEAEDGWSIALDTDGTFCCPSPDERNRHLPAVRS